METFVGSNSFKHFVLFFCYFLQKRKSVCALKIWLANSCHFNGIEQRSNFKDDEPLTVVVTHHFLKRRRACEKHAKFHWKCLLSGGFYLRTFLLFIFRTSVGCISLPSLVAAPRRRTWCTKSKQGTVWKQKASKHRSLYGTPRTTRIVRTEKTQSVQTGTGRTWSGSGARWVR